MKHITYPVLPPVSLALFAALSLPAADKLQAAVALDLIGNVDAYEFANLSIPLPSQVYPDFPANNCTVIEDFTAIGDPPRISTVQLLLFAQTGFVSFSKIDGYHINIYTSPTTAATGFQGDILSAFFPSSAASVTPVSDPASGDEYGLVSLPVELQLPAAGTFWIGISPQASYSTGGDFRLAAANSTGTTNSAGTANAIFTNPGGGFGIPGNSIQQDHAVAIAISVVPEPAAPALLLLAAGACCLSRKRGRG